MKRKHSIDETINNNDTSKKKNKKRNVTSQDVASRFFNNIDYRNLVGNILRLLYPKDRLAFFRVFPESRVALEDLHQSLLQEDVINRFESSILSSPIDETLLVMEEDIEYFKKIQEKKKYLLECIYDFFEDNPTARLSGSFLTECFYDKKEKGAFTAKDIDIFFINPILEIENKSNLYLSFIYRFSLLERRKELILKYCMYYNIYKHFIDLKRFEKDDVISKEMSFQHFLNTQDRNIDWGIDDKINNIRYGLNSDFVMYTCNLFTVESKNNYMFNKRSEWMREAFVEKNIQFIGYFQRGGNANGNILSYPDENYNFAPTPSTTEDIIKTDFDFDVSKNTFRLLRKSHKDYKNNRVHIFSEDSIIYKKATYTSRLCFRRDVPFYEKDYAELKHEVKMLQHAYVRCINYEKKGFKLNTNMIDDIFNRYFKEIEKYASRLEEYRYFLIPTLGFLLKKEGDWTLRTGELVIDAVETLLQNKKFNVHDVFTFDEEHELTRIDNEDILKMFFHKNLIVYIFMAILVYFYEDQHFKKHEQHAEYSSCERFISFVISIDINHFKKQWYFKTRFFLEKIDKDLKLEDILAIKYKEEEEK
jgi:hypothetical protein